MSTISQEIDHRNTLFVKDGYLYWLQSYPTESMDAQDTFCLRRFLPPFQKPGRIFTDNSMEFVKACQDLQWTTPHRSETNGIAERAVRRVKEGTSAVLLKSGSDLSKWPDQWNCAMEC